MDEIYRAHIEMLRAQNQELLTRNAVLERRVNEIPRLLLEARLDAKAGKQTSYRYGN